MRMPVMVDAESDKGKDKSPRGKKKRGYSI
jgi:hypothetical protein